MVLNILLCSCNFLLCDIWRCFISCCRICLFFFSTRAFLLPSLGPHSLPRLKLLKPTPCRIHSFRSTSADFRTSNNHSSKTQQPLNCKPNLQKYSTLGDGNFQIHKACIQPGYITELKREREERKRKKNNNLLFKDILPDPTLPEIIFPKVRKNQN